VRVQCVHEDCDLCKSNFVCGANAMDNSIPCDVNADLVDGGCICKSGFVGNGLPCRAPPADVWKAPGTDGRILTQRYENICGCQIPKVDFCEGNSCPKVRVSG
jgi:hypothetical protein